MLSSHDGSEARARRLAELRPGRHELAEVLAFFDELPAVRVADMFGTWRGGPLPTGHRLDGVLETLGWYGKRFIDDDDVRPLLFHDSRGVFEVNPDLVPVSFAVDHGLRLARWAPSARAARRAIRLLKTDKPKARLRMIEHRGVVTATMAYDGIPVNDHFRRVDERTVIGLMDIRGYTETPFLFTLERFGPRKLT
ncbi:DUF4334 domain-containing protein [Quadrisphaera granulorum]|uniref:DUF4334 domain-containing protein n=1 Tax=Quadrisphaera granulorum TaxID=317664 RepID=UPI001B880088|nr:DUF4334 domain-containing protein [Quadrisphaera granulorum]